MIQRTQTGDATRTHTHTNTMTHNTHTHTHPPTNTHNKTTHTHNHNDVHTDTNTHNEPTHTHTPGTICSSVCFPLSRGDVGLAVVNLRGAERGRRQEKRRDKKRERREVADKSLCHSVSLCQAVVLPTATQTLIMEASVGAGVAE